MNRTLIVAWREFTSVVITKGFLLGLLLPPVMFGIAITAVMLLKNTDGPRLRGHVALIDKTGMIGELADKRVQQAFQERRQAVREQATKQIDKTAKQLNLPQDKVDQAKSMMQTGVNAALPPGDIRVQIASEGDLDKLKAQLAETEIHVQDDKGTGGAGGDNDPLISVVVIHPDAVVPGPEGKFGVFDQFMAPKVDVEIQSTLERGIGDAIVDTRIAQDKRVTGAGLDAATLRAMLARPNIEAVTVTKGGGERKSIGELQMLIPVAFMVLLMISVMTTGQYLMTTVIEEKSNRVMEVLLSAASPMQLMTGKVLGHMSVGALIVFIYGGVGITGLIVFALTQLVTPLTFLFLIAYFVVAAVTMAAIMAAVGSAVNELREAQTLLTPIMMVTMLPWMIWFLIQRAPNSPMATGLSFVPILSPYVMVLRLGGSEPVPMWQHPVALLIGGCTSVGALWAAAKIFRIGVLMYGKAPNLGTLVRWIRMA
ncbi:MAG: ABC transporter permease [Phycisphaerales bacterium]